MKKDQIKEKMKTAKVKLPSKKKPPREYGPIEIRMLSEDETADDESTSEHAIIDELNGESPNSEHRFESNRKYYTICVYALITVVIATVFICLIVNFTALGDRIKELAHVLAPFIAAFFIAFILNPLVKWVESVFLGKICKMKKPRARVILAIALTYIFVIGLIVVGLFVVIPQISDSIVKIGTDATNKLNELYDNRDYYADMIEKEFPDLKMDYLEKKFEEMWPTILSTLTNVTKDLVPKILNMTVSLAKLAINVLLSIAISLYMLADSRKLKRLGAQVIYAVLPTDRAKVCCKLMSDCGAIFSNFVSGKALDSLIIGMICFLATTFLKLDYAVLISVIVGLTNMIPYFGPLIGAVPGILMYLCINPVDALVFAIMILALQQFDGWVLGPKILGDSTGLSPLWVIFGITVGGAYGGVIGMFIGVPTVAVVAYLLNTAIMDKLKKKRIEIS